MKYAHKNYCWWDSRTCTEAAGAGHLGILIYSHENGCKWDEDTCFAAAKNGHLDCLKYAYENGCKWDEETCSAAAKNGNTTVTHMLRKMGALASNLKLMCNDCCSWKIIKVIMNIVKFFFNLYLEYKYFIFN